LAAFFSASLLHAALPTGLGGLGQEQSEVSEKRVERKLLDSQESSDLMDKRFPMKSWGEHFSPLGSKRAAISMQESKSKKMFNTEQKSFPTQQYELSQLNQRMMELHEKAGISTDQRARQIADQQLYEMALQDTTQKYEEMREKLSLRDINRFQFRHNRSDEAVPVQAAGQGK
jgi:hypothetical protein